MIFNRRANSREGTEIAEKRLRALWAAFPLCSLWLFSLFVIISTAVTAQQKTKPDSITHYKVKFSNGDYKFTPADGYLFLRTKNRIKITNTKGKPFAAKLVGGNISKVIGDSIFEIDGLIKPGNVLICLYEKDAKGKDKPVLNKPVTVVPYPKAKFAGVACDSAMPAIQLAMGTFNIHYDALKMKVPVTSFKMEFYDKGKFTLDSSNNNKLSKKMLQYVEKLKPGSLVYLSDIKYKDPNGKIQSEAVYRAFIIKEKPVIKFGVD